MMRLAFFVLLAAFQPLAGASLRTIIVADTFAENIQVPCTNDLVNVQKWTNKICDYTGLQLDETLVFDLEATADHLFSVLNQMECLPDDTLFFYFTGHGFRTKIKVTPWPALYLTNSDLGVDLAQVIELLSSKGARLVIAIADCCNNILPLRQAPPIKKGTANLSKIKAGYKKLFCQQRGLVAAASSKPGQLSWCYESGALFTLKLMDTLDEEAADSKRVCWEDILERVAVSISRFQDPYVLINH
jgi:hypothetical protein